MLTTAEQVMRIPGFQCPAIRGVAWVNDLILAASAAVQQYCKRDIELTNYVDYYDGANQVDLVIRQRPVWSAQTNVAGSSIGAVLPQATINVASTVGFCPGMFGDPNAVPPSIGIQTGVSSFSWVTYTGTTATTFTGCSGGTGTMMNNPSPQATNPTSVYSPVIHYDPQAARGTSPSAFGPGTQMVLGLAYMVVTDRQGRGATAPLPLGVKASNRGLIRRWGGGGAPMGGWWWPQNYYGDKLAGTRHACWPIGDGAIRVMYSAGFLQVPADVAYATAMLVAQMARIQPQGSDMSSENLGAYSYNILSEPTDPAMGTIRRTLNRWRESAWSSGS